MKPKLPDAASILPYLHRIDASRTYSNFGPLNTELETRLCGLYGAEERVVTTLSNATIALTLVLQSFGVRRGSLCVLPAWTFVASVHAAIMAGMQPYFVDVDPSTWALDPQAVGAALAAAPGDVGAVMPVAPFGSPIDPLQWAEFRDRTGVPVVIDAAAGFDAARPSSVPTVVSLHATKTLGIGEGALVLHADPAAIGDIRARANFGFAASREARMPAANAKLSEYHAAVGLAALDEWPAARAEWMTAAAAYAAVLPSNHLKLQPGFGETWVGSACVVELLASGAVRAEAVLAEAGIETRRWWGHGAHRHPATMQFPRADLRTTEHLAETTLGLPFHRDLSAAAVEQVARTLRDAGVFPDA